jgi:hypothetical protein
MLWRVLLLAALGGALVEEHDQRGGHPEDDEDSVVIEGEFNKEQCELFTERVILKAHLLKHLNLHVPPNLKILPTECIYCMCFVLHLQ